MNCGDPTPGEYCPTCGQRKTAVQVSVHALIMDVLEDQLILDKRLPRTMGALLFKPGHLTVEHVNGRIVRYIHPFRLYLATSLVFFLLLSFFSLRLVRNVGTEQGPGVVSADSVTRELVSLDTAIAQIDRQLADTLASPVQRSALEATRSQLADERTALLALQAVVPDTSAPDTVAAAGGAEPDTTPPPTSAGADRSLGSALGWDRDPPEVHVGIAALDEALTGRLRRIGAMEPRDAAETLVDTFFNYVPTMMFILLPVFAGVLKLLYMRRRRYYAEHFVFLLHVHSFVFILATVMLVVGRWVGGWLDALLGLWILVYILLAMKRVYGQGWLITFAKYWTLGWMYFWILLISMPFAFLATLLLT